MFASMQVDVPMGMDVIDVAPAMPMPKPKRKRSGSIELESEYEAREERNMRVRMLPPSVEGPGGFAFPLTTMPDLVPDNSTSASASESGRMDGDDLEMDEPYLAPEAQYSYSAAGSGGVWFGPGADEDELSDDGYPNIEIYPSMTANPNPHHFSNNPPYSAFPSAVPDSTPVTPCTPWSAQPYATNLVPPGLLQPAAAAPLGPEATAVERARSQHGPNCKSIPKLRMSDYPDPATGQRSLWTVCEDCGACERAS